MKTCVTGVVLFGLCMFSMATADGAEADLLKMLQSAPKLETEDICFPMKTTRNEGLYRVPNPDGKTWDILQVYAPSYGHEIAIVIIDMGTGEVKQIRKERGLNFHLAPAVVAPNGKLYISILIRGLRQQICIYDPGTNEMTFKALPIPDTLKGETHPLTLGTDGKLYMIGQHPSRTAGACQIDPDTHKVTDYGPIGPSHAPNSCWGYYGGADDRYIYIASGKIPWYLVAYDRQTGKSEVLVETERVGGSVSVRQGRFGCTASASKIVGTDGARVEYWLYKGKAIVRKDRKEKPPWPVPAGAGPLVPLPPKVEVNRSRAVPSTEGDAEIWVRTPEAKAKATARERPPADARPEDLGWQVFKFNVPTYPQGIYRLRELPDGRLFGTAGAYQGNFIYDPKTKQSVHMGKIHLSHYATTLHDGKIYMSGYPTSPLYVYDPAKPWTANTPLPDGKTVSERGTESNPRLLLRLGSKQWAGTHKMYAAATGADGKVYFGGKWVRDGAAGGLAWWDPKEEKAGGFWKIFSNYQITHMTTADNGRFLVISTRRVEDSLLGKPKPEQGKLFVYDVIQQKMVREIEPVIKARGTGPVAGVGGGRVIGWTVNPEDVKVTESRGRKRETWNSSVLYGVDVKTGKVFFRHVLPLKLPVRIGSNQKEAFDFRLGPKGAVWTFMERCLVRISPGNGVIRPVGKISRGGAIAFSGDDIYLAGTTALRRIKRPRK